MVAQLELSVHHGLDSVVHILDKVLLRAAESAAIGDVEDAIVSVGVLAMAATDLHAKLVGDALKSGPVLHQVGKVDVDGGAKGCSEVGWARRDVTQVVVVREAGDLLDSLGGARETLEDGANVCTLLHGDDTELVLFVDPDEESLRIVVEDTSALGPVAVQATGLEETVTLPSKK